MLGSHAITNGAYSLQVKVAGGGSVDPDGYRFLDVQDPAEMKGGLDQESLPNFVAAARGAAERSGLTLGDLDFVCPLHTKRSMFEALLSELGMTEDQAVYLDDTGHMSGVDPLLGLDRAVRDGRVGDGDAVLLLSAGTGYTWAATVVRWGEPRHPPAEADAARHAALPTRPVPARPHGSRVRGRAAHVRGARPAGGQDRERPDSGSASRRATRSRRCSRTASRSIELYHAAARTGLVVVPLSPLLRGSGLTNLARRLGRAHPDHERGAWCRSSTACAPSCTGIAADRYVLVDGEAPGYLSYRAARRGGEPRRRPLP